MVNHSVIMKKKPSRRLGWKEYKKCSSRMECLRKVSFLESKGKVVIPVKSGKIGDDYPYTIWMRVK
jgi:hypothetical protein